MSDQTIDLEGVRKGDALLDEAERLREESGREKRAISDDELEAAYMSEERQTYTVSEAADLTGYHPESIRRHIRKGKLKAAQTGKGNYRISRSELERWWRDELDGGELFDDDGEQWSLREIEGAGREAGREAVSVAADVLELDPENFPLPGDWRWLESELDREPTERERDAFAAGYLDVLEDEKRKATP